MSLLPLDLSSWIEIDEHFAAELELKNQLLQQRHSEVFASLADSEFGQREALDLLLQHLLQTFPQHYSCKGPIIENHLAGQTWQREAFAAAPLDLAGRLVQEDLCLMQPSPQGYVLAAASVCFPSRWLLREKLGRPMSQIHQPVPAYPEQLERPVDRFFNYFKIDKPVWRLNWSVTDSPELFLLPRQNQSPVDSQANSQINATNAGENLWIRVERQTLRRLPQTGNILFTIRTYVQPLKRLEAKPKAAQNLAAIIQQLPINMQRYKGITPIREALLGYLAQIKTSN
ncbi:DUF3445 domain-containing protein [Leptolyngbya sp. FACHB-261]|nr:DUF3445 domain-containing protein [Leptolyngbya sp. FACHB-261]